MIINLIGHYSGSTTMQIDIQQVHLVNILGQTVKSWNSTNAPLSHECKIPVRKISEGSYIIKVRTTDNSVINKKIVIKQD